MNKIDLEKLNINKETLYEYYIEQNHSKKETSQYFNIAMFTLSNLLEKFSLRKDTSTIAAARRKTCIEKYIVDNPGKSSSVKEKIISSNMKRYGTKSFTSTEKGKRQVKQTKEARYGDSNYNNMEKNRQTKKERYNDPYYNNREKNRETCLERYGVKNGGVLASMRRKHYKEDSNK